jgi:hypothetical protein
MVAAMAVDPGETVTTGLQGADPPPRMLPRPADAPPPLDPLHESEQLRALHGEWARLHGGPTGAPTPADQWRRVRGKARRMLPMGGPERELLGALIRTVDALALRCDAIAERLGAQETLMEGVAGSFGEDITRVRADLQQVRAALPSLPAQ